MLINDYKYSQLNKLNIVFIHIKSNDFKLFYFILIIFKTALL